ncbi:murein transglycosylase [Vibrio coralliilyticus]|uniref:murein transglycosylase n=1 Tax=Vibrio coralliilyticus TaxID=190893 RepID=UPI00155F6AC8|nr:murein transglycosylase [Vibrio coralliilyticus]NRF28011.1 murein transglycosylase [Vibrio coralliilyticus]NRF82134.1 murein transglycosylase [Vibrio coralliilyticus]
MMLTFSKSLHRIPSSILTWVSMVCSASLATSAMASDLQQQRKIYDQAQEYLDNNQVTQYQKIRNKIKDYPLTPYTDYRAFLVDIGQHSPAEVEAFIDTYSTLPFSARIRAPYIDSLARQKQWQKLAEFQTVEPRGETYQCHYYHALYRTGHKDQAFEGAEKLWHSGQSIADACDPLFEVWDKAGLRTDQQILERMLLAFEARNGSLMNYLKKQLNSDKARKQASDMKALFNRPENVVNFARQHSDSDFNRSQTGLALKKLARKDVRMAQQAFDQATSAQKMPLDEAQKLADYIAFRLINTDSESLAQWRDKKIETSSNNDLIERRVRLAIQEADWHGVEDWIGHLPDKKQQSLRWQYWLGRSEVALGDITKGSQRLENLVGQRNFYSVAAAKEIKRSINYPVSTISFERQAVKPFMTALVRIEELIERDKIAAAKSEWRWLLNRANAEQKEMLAAYASYKDWSHLTVTASIKAKMWDNLELRFPVAHRWWFNFYGEKHSIDPITLMSLARQESGLDVEARSPVGARGIMQIMPSTAKYTARKYQLSYRSSNDLYEVGKNIEIGSHYLKGLLERYDNNRIFALAAYNAGPHRVKTWRERTQGKLDAYAFIEAIPFKETRGYVQNILMFETYYRNLLGVDGAFLNQNEIDTRY